MDRKYKADEEATSSTSTCQCGASRKLSEMIEINHRWSRDYEVLRRDCERLKLVEEKFEKLKKDFEETRYVGGTFEEAGSRFSTHDVEALKQQLIVYKEDFDEQRRERKKTVEINKRLEIELQMAHEIIEKLSEKNKRIQDCYTRIRSEKNHILTELKKLYNFSSSNYYEVKTRDDKYVDILRREDVIAHGAPRREVTRIDVTADMSSK